MKKQFVVREHHMNKQFTDALCTMLKHPKKCPMETIYQMATAVINYLILNNI